MGEIASLLLILYDVGHTIPHSRSKMKKAQALWFEEKGRTSIRKETLPASKPGWCQVRTLFTAISPGTERLVLSGKVPESQHEVMSCPYMGGTFPFPVKYGYSLVGRVSAGSHEIKGRIVHLLHPHQDRCLVREEDVFPVPSIVPPERATLASNMETAVNAVWDGKVTTGDKVLVVGFGIIGSLIARILSLYPGVELGVYDTDSQKTNMASDFGFKALSRKDIPQDFDVVFHCSGDSGGLQLAIDHTGFEGRIIELSWYGTDRLMLSLGGQFHDRRLSIQSSQVSTISPVQRPRWDAQRRKELVFRLLTHPAFDAHITHTMAFQELPKMLASLMTLPTPGLSYLVNY